MHVRGNTTILNIEKKQKNVYSCENKEKIRLHCPTLKYFDNNNQKTREGVPKFDGI